MPRSGQKPGWKRSAGDEESRDCHGENPGDPESEDRLDGYTGGFRCGARPADGDRRFRDDVGYEYKPSANGGGFDFTVEVREVGEVFPYRFEDLPVADGVLRAALHAQEPLWGERIPIPAIRAVRGHDRYKAGVKAAVTWKVEEPQPGCAGDRCSSR